MKRKDINNVIHRLTERKALLSRENQSMLSFKAEDVKNPFARLPNVLAYELTTNQMDPLLQNLGISKRLTPHVEVERLNHRIRAANRYMRIMFGRLVNLLKKGRTDEY